MNFTPHTKGPFAGFALDLRREISPASNLDLKLFNKTFEDMSPNTGGDIQVAVDSHRLRTAFSSQRRHHRN
jgi:hypothetical protein